MFQFLDRKKLLLTPLSSLVLLGVITPISSSSEGLNLIADIQGEVLVKRRFWIGHRRANLGDILSSQDRIKLAPGSSTRIICSNLADWYPPAGDSQVSVGCPSTRGVLRRHRDPTGGTRGPNQDSPYLISPRNTAILPGQPLKLTWNSVTESNNYQISLKKLSQVIWTVNTSESEIFFRDLDKLQRDRAYIINITADTGESEPQGTEIAPTIKVLSNEKVQELEANIAQIEAAGLDAEAKALALAYIYHAYELHQLALDILAEQIDTGTQNVETYHLQAKLYQQIGLPNFAQRRYLTALELAESSNVAQQAEIQEQLGQISEQVGDWEKVVLYLSEAEANYRSILDVTNPEVQRRLENLQNKILRAREFLPSL